MAIILRASFEGGNDGDAITTTNEPGISGTIGTAPTFSAAQKRFGNNSMLTVSGGGTNGSIRQNTSGTVTRLFYRAYVKRVTAASTNANMINVRDSATTTITAITMTATGKFNLRDGSTQVASSTNGMAVGDWARIELDVDRGGGTQALSIYLGANIESSTPTETISGASTAGVGDIGSVLTGLPVASSGAQYAYDEVAIGDSAIGPYVAATYTVSVWNGTSEDAATARVWDGTTEVAAQIDSVA